MKRNFPPAHCRYTDPNGARSRRTHGALIAACTAISLTCGCSSPGGSPLSAIPTPADLPIVHKIDIQQGNVITQEMISRLERGMDKKKVHFVMGTPIIMDTFNTQRWDYVYTFKPGGGHTEGRRVTLVFVDEKLDHLEGNVTPAMRELVVSSHHDVNVEVPLYVKKNLFTKIKDKIPFAGDEEDEYVYDVAELKGEDKGSGADDENAEGSEQSTSEDGTAEEADDTRIATGPTVLVPKDAPTNKKKRGFFRRILDGVGLGAAEDEEPGEYDPGDPKYKDITNPDNL